MVLLAKSYKSFSQVSGRLRPYYNRNINLTTLCNLPNADGLLPRRLRQAGPGRLRYDSQELWRAGQRLSKGRMGRVTTSVTEDIQNTAQSYVYALTTSSRLI